jgi:hypothetical protein
MPTLDDVYRKFGETAEAAQLLETELGTDLFVKHINTQPKKYLSSKRTSKELLNTINRKTLGRLFLDLGVEKNAADGFGDLLHKALEERNRLFHSFYREHNIRRNSEEGRYLMMQDLEVMHSRIIEAYKAVFLVKGIDLDAMVAKMNSNCDDEPPYGHLPI